MQYIIGIGVQKAATSWLHTILSEHPEVDGSKPKEVDFFSYYFDRGYQWYKKHFKGDKTFRLDMSPSYFIDPRTPQRLFDFAPDAKIILMLRDPIDRAYSNHLHEIVKEHIEPTDFFTGAQNNPMYFEQSLYAKHLENWINVFPSVQIRIIYQEDLLDNKEAIAYSIFKFIDIDPNFRVPSLHEKRNISDHAKSKTLRKITRVAGDTLRSIGMEKPLAAIKSSALIDRLLKANSVDAKANIRALTSSERSMLCEYFQNDQDKLNELITKHDLVLKY